MGDIERPVGEGERPAVADVQLEAVGDGQRRRARATAAARTSGRLSSATTDRPRARSVGPAEEGERDVGAARPDVEQASTSSRCAASASMASALRRDAAEPAIDPAQVAQVAGQRGRVVERAVEELDGIGAAVHPSQGTPRPYDGRHDRRGR